MLELLGILFMSILIATIIGFASLADIATIV